MKRKIKHIEECRKLLEIEVPSPEVKKRIDDFYEKISRSASVPGFRPGRAPRDLVEKHYGERATREVVEDIISDYYYTAVEEEGFVPLGLPHISDVKLDDSKALFFKAEFNVRPNIELKIYKGLKLNKKKLEIKEEEVEKSVKALQEASAKFSNAQGRGVALGDYIICDSQVLIDSKPISAKRENIWMPIEEKSYIPNLSAKLIGANVGDEKEIETTLPEDFQNKEYAGKTAVFKIKINEIKQKVLPQIDDEFAKDLGYNILPELKGSVKKMLQNQAEQRVEQDLKNQALEGLLENSNFNVPSSLVERQLEHLFEDEKARLMRQGLKMEDITSKEKGLKEKLKPISLKQVKTMFILDEIAAKEGIKVSKEEVDEALEAIARQSNQTKEKVIKHYEDNDLTAGLTAEIRNEKVMDFLIKEAKIEEGQT